MPDDSFMPGNGEAKMAGAAKIRPRKTTASLVEARQDIVGHAGKPRAPSAIPLET